MKPFLPHLAVIIPFQSQNTTIIQLAIFTATNLIKISISLNGNIVIDDKHILETEDKRKRKKYVIRSRKLIELIYSDNFLSFFKRLPKTIIWQYNNLDQSYGESNIEYLQTDIDYVNKMLKSDIFSIDTLKTNFNVRQTRYYSKCSDGEKFFFSKRSLRSIYSNLSLFSGYTNDH